MASFSFGTLLLFHNPPPITPAATKQRALRVYFSATYFILKINIFLALATKLLLNFPHAPSHTLPAR